MGLQEKDPIVVVDQSLQVVSPVTMPWHPVSYRKVTPHANLVLQVVTFVVLMNAEHVEEQTVICFLGDTQTVVADQL